MDIRKIKFARTVYAERQLAKLCPNNKINEIGKLLSNPDFIKQTDSLFQVFDIMHRAYEMRAKFEDPENFEPVEFSKEMFECLTDSELEEMTNLAFENFEKDGRTEIETQKKKEEVNKETNESI